MKPLCKLRADQVKDLALVHNINLDAIGAGQANEVTLQSVAEAALIWTLVAKLLGLSEPEMAAQVDLVATLIERFRRTGKVLFTGVEYQLAKEGVQVMGQLGEAVDQCTASRAVDWCERRFVQCFGVDAERNAA